MIFSGFHNPNGQTLLIVLIPRPCSDITDPCLGYEKQLCDDHEHGEVTADTIANIATPSVGIESMDSVVLVPSSTAHNGNAENHTGAISSLPRHADQRLHQSDENEGNGDDVDVYVDTDGERGDVDWCANTTRCSSHCGVHVLQQHQQREERCNSTTIINKIFPSPYPAHSY